ncbi:hypothetical protein [Stackebrandtia nassauensis]|uniref:Uncharacterized protein n=1 Tax=Stackebrandtia nassauensis (strain DSM 44728 / CIP 108903 / NRRL B-16338 / NBRC 102104 / LLR-40K-21) TaxID=446470 RepID=D3Q1K5_STANL|nr:hypothetical protein [Stackebrandtia nassauensis]ADD39853.1 hypothetical protein Snas_0132 [Stackebrandtia nassauensis DSM 44728]
MRKSIKALAVAAVAAGFGALALAGTAQAGPTGAEEMGMNPTGGGVSILSDICAGNWNGPVITGATANNTDTRDLCSGYNGSDDAQLKLGSNLCALNWDWNDAAKVGVINSVKDYRLCHAK